MKATLEFDLPDERPEFLIASNSDKLACCVCEIQRILRAYTKYESYSTEELVKLLQNELAEVEPFID